MSCLREWMQVVAPFAAALVVYLFGLSAYRRQRQYDLVRLRYLDEAVDQAAAELEKTMAAFRHNWIQGMLLIKQIRYLERDIGPEDWERSFTFVDQSVLELRAHYRLETLVGDKVFWECQQKALAFSQKAASFFIDDLRKAARKLARGDETVVSMEEVAETYEKEAKRLEQACHVYYRFSTMLQDLAAILERRWFTFRSIRRFRHRRDVRDIVQKARQLYDEELSSTDSLEDDTPAG